MSHDADRGTLTSMRPVLLRVLLFSILGIPLTAYLWETINKIVALDFSAVRIAVALPALILFVALIWLLAREVTRLEHERRD
jgi:hypothetical protein